jgi:hypothetical protein
LVPSGVILSKFTYNTLLIYYFYLFKIIPASPIEKYDRRTSQPYDKGKEKN